MIETITMSIKLPKHVGKHVGEDCEDHNNEHGHGNQTRHHPAYVLVTLACHVAQDTCSTPPG